MPIDPRHEREHWLRQAVLAGDESAWRTLYVEAFDPLYRFVRGRCGSRADWVDEIVQETWLVAVRRIVDFDPQRGPLQQWLRGIALNQLRNRVRRHGLVTNPEWNWNELAEESSTANVTDTRGEVELTLAALDDRHAAVLRAKYLDAQSVQEIAESWEQTPKAIESLLTRARRAFRAAYERLLGR